MGRDARAIAHALRVSLCRPARPEVDRPVATALQLAHQVLDGADIGLEFRRADTDEAHQVRVAAAVGPVAVAADQLLDALILALPAAAVDRLDGDHAVERRLRALALEELQVRLGGSPAVVGELGVEVQIEDHYTGRNFASVISAVTSSNTTSTAMPTRTASGAQPTTFVIMRTPSSSSTIAST